MIYGKTLRNIELFVNIELLVYVVKRKGYNLLSKSLFRFQKSVITEYKHQIFILAIPSPG